MYKQIQLLQFASLYTQLKQAILHSTVINFLTEQRNSDDYIGFLHIIRRGNTRFEYYSFSNSILKSANNNLTYKSKA
jgi:hypothetical protein